MVDAGVRIPGDTPDQEGGDLKTLAFGALNWEGQLQRFLPCVLVHLPSQNGEAVRLSFPMSFSRALYHSEQKSNVSAWNPCRLQDTVDFQARKRRKKLPVPVLVFHCICKLQPGLPAVAEDSAPNIGATPLYPG
ncbi:armadillo repeat-containing X-linked protein 1 isoform X2 [Enhydra lutris kenyoni]|uniref:Armadillo repeat-containing X-linked protein 1 isoform X2 n=1 Tax=Enhydra lutris kenyoni TaxID=391180 RepID=A0A2Y9L1A2_ENHLU|nr:armadillo repeat-containing X-linked protein 1 isoform X2 [Enhydra lutris kenyoni]